MPEECMWLIAAALGYAGHIGQALYVATLFATHLRPSALHGLYTDDLAAPKADGEDHHGLIIAPVEREKGTKTGFFDGTIIPDGDVCVDLGKLLEEHCHLRELAVTGAGEVDVGAPVPMRGFKPRSLLTNFEGAVKANAPHDIDTLVQARHGRASRDHLLRKRTAEETGLRPHHTTQPSFRLYNKPGRLLRIVNALDREDLAHASCAEANFASYIRAAEFPRPSKWHAVAWSSLGFTRACKGARST